MIERFIAYFHDSGFEYLALDFDGYSVRLSREPLPQGAAASDRQSVGIVGPSVGFIALANGREHFPRAGVAVVAGEPLFTLRRFKSTMDVQAPAAGILRSVLVEEGSFVEYGQTLAILSTM